MEHGLTWKDYLLIALIQVIASGGTLAYVHVRYPAMASYAEQVGREIAGKASEVLKAFDERLKKVEAK